MSNKNLPPLEIDPSLSAKENLLRLINRDNGTSATISQITFQSPLEYDDPWDKNNRNTSVTVTGLPTSEYPGSYTFKYWRQSLHRIAEEFVVDMDELDRQEIPNDTIEDIHAYVCSQLKLIPDEVYISATEIPEFDWENPVHEMYLTANLLSYTYTRSIKLVLVRDTRIDLDDIFGPGGDGVIVDPDLGGIIIGGDFEIAPGETGG